MSQGQLKLADFGLARTYTDRRLRASAADGSLKDSEDPKLTGRVITLWYRCVQMQGRLTHASACPCFLHEAS